jgi:hypothetical protein
MKRIVPLVTIGLGMLFALPAAMAEASSACSNEKEVENARAEFLRLRDLHSLDASRISDEVFEAAAREYIEQAEACYQEKYGKRAVESPIDDGGVWFESPDVPPGFVTFGTKWGPDSPYPGGTDVPGPGTPGGEVTYSFMGDGVDISAEGADPNVAISSLPTFSPCFITEIENGFDAWAAVADITFTEVPDDGLPFNTGAQGDIRIGAHTFDGPGGTLAHGFYPPPNGVTAAGDIHFDRDEPWDCIDDGSTFDLGIVGTHEIGHAIGLQHENVDLALMNPFYNPVVDIPLVDDIEGAESIYGSTGVSCSISATASTYSGSQVVTIATMTVQNSTGGSAPVEWKVWILTPGGNELNLANIGTTGSFYLPDGYFLDFADPDLPFFAANSQPHGSWAFGCRVEDPRTGKDYDSMTVTFETTP